MKSKHSLFFMAFIAILLSSCGSSRGMSSPQKKLPFVIGVGKKSCANSDKARTNGEKRRKKDNRYK